MYRDDWLYGELLVAFFEILLELMEQLLVQWVVSSRLLRS